MPPNTVARPGVVFLEIEQATREGWRLLTVPFAPSEGWLLDTMIEFQRSRGAFVGLVRVRMKGDKAGTRNGLVLAVK